MLSKCANPDCNARFRYLRSGKLFRFDVAASDAVAQKAGATGVRAVPKKPSHRVEHFWLCGECAASMTLEKDSRNDSVIIIPLKKQSRRATA